MRNRQNYPNVQPNVFYEELFEQYFGEGILQKQKSIAEFKRKYPSDLFSEYKYKAILLSKLNKLKLEYNKLIYPEYYQCLPEKEDVKRIFVDNYLLNIDIGNHQIELRKTIELNGMINFLEDELREIKEELIPTSLDLELLRHQINDIISIMVPNH